MAGTGAVRLAFADDLFLRRHRGLGAPVVNQLVWTFAAPLPPGHLDDLARRLARGPLGRRAVRVRVPAGRDRWRPEVRVPPVASSPHVLAPSGVPPWLGDRAAEPLDPAAGPGWRLAVAPVEGGGQVVSLVVAHAVADGAAMVDAVVRAARATPGPPHPDVSGPRALALDVADAATQVGSVARWAWRAARARGAAAPGPPAPPAPTASSGLLESPDPGWSAPWLAVELDSGAVARLAERTGGTPNSWFVAATAGLVRRAGRPAGTPPGAVPLALPVSTRRPDDLRGNTTRIARVALDPALLDPARSGRTDLGAVRAACREAYARLAAGGDAPEPVPLALVQALPDAVVRRLPRPPAAAALASNLGRPAPDFLDLGTGTPARSVAALAHQQGLAAEDALADGGGLLSWCCDTGATTTWSVSAVDPVRVPGEDDLERLVRAELGGWGLEVRGLVTGVSP